MIELFWDLHKKYAVDLFLYIVISSAEISFNFMDYIVHNP